MTITTKEKRLAYTDIEISHSQHALITLNFLTVLLIESLNAFTLLKSVDSGKLFQALIILHAKKRLLAELVLLGLYSLYMWPRVTVHGHNLKKSSHINSRTPNTIL